MKKEKLGQEPAFANGSKNTVHSDGTSNGMSKRFYAACAAMQGILANQNGEYAVTGRTHQQYVECLIYQSYQFADEILKQENL